MPRVRLTYQRDIDREGTDVIETTDRHAQIIVSERRGEILTDEPEKPAKRARKSK